MDFDNELDTDWANLIQPLNHTTVFGYLLGYPLIYYYSLTTLIDVNTLINYRVYVNIDQEILLYSFSSPVHENLNQTEIDHHVNRWYSTLSSQMNSIKMIEHVHLKKDIRVQSVWCL